jgi:putative copper resistance protein D
MATTVVAALIGTGLTQVSAVPELARAPTLVRFGIPAARALLDLGAVAAVGIGLLARLLGFDDPAATEPVMRRVRKFAVWASVLWAVAAAGSIVLLTWEISAISGGGFPSPAQILSYVANISAGKGLLLSAGCAVLCWWLAALSVRHGEKVPAELRVGVALFGLLPLPLTGHASNWYWHDVAMIRWRCTWWPPPPGQADCWRCWCSWLAAPSYWR